MHKFFRSLPCLMDRLKGIGDGPCDSIEKQVVSNSGSKSCPVSLDLVLLDARGVKKSLKKSIGIVEESTLGKILNKITNAIINKFPDFSKPYVVKHNDIAYSYHVELIDDENDIQ